MKIKILRMQIKQYIQLKIYVIDHWKCQLYTINVDAKSSIVKQKNRLTIKQLQ